MHASTFVLISFEPGAMHSLRGRRGLAVGFAGGGGGTVVAGGAGLVAAGVICSWIDCRCAGWGSCFGVLICTAGVWLVLIVASRAFPPKLRVMASDPPYSH